jgi:hypothetical protein
VAAYSNQSIAYTDLPPPPTQTVADNVPKLIMIDPLRLKQIIANGITNALKNTAAGSVTLQVRLLPSAGPVG